MQHTRPETTTAVAARPGAPQSDALYSRNWAFLSADDQARLKTATIFTAGTGLGSVIACLAARTGFQRFLLADGDVVEESNLNRQAFFRSQTGKNKATVTASLIANISPDARFKILPRFVSTEDFATLAPQATVVINTIDLDNPAFLTLNRAARAVEAPVLFPINLGWGGAVVAFTPTAPSLDDFLGIDADGEGTPEIATRLVERILQHLPGPMPDYIAEMLTRYIARDAESWPADPQLGVAAHLTAALTVRAAVSLTLGQPIREAPEVMWLDALEHVAAPTLQPAEVTQAARR